MKLLVFVLATSRTFVGVMTQVSLAHIEPAQLSFAKCANFVGKIVVSYKSFFVIFRVLLDLTCLRASLSDCFLIDAIFLFVDPVDSLSSGVGNVDLEGSLADGNLVLVNQPYELVALIVGYWVIFVLRSVH